jgi:glycine/D-amino acid oxidase-like deaminating enzyme
VAAPPHVLVVGAGIIGASIAWHLASDGARVTVIDGGPPGGIATRNSWAWINASWANPEPYFRLRVRAMDEWHRLEQAVPGLRVAWVGGLIWELPPDQLEAFAVQHAAWGYDIRRVGRRAAHKIEPYLAVPPEFALHVPAEGSVEPLAAALALLQAAQDHGATVITNTPVRRLVCSTGVISGVETDTGRHSADTVVLACGSGTASLLATVGLNLALTGSPALLVVTQPHDECLKGLVMAPAMQVRQTAEGRLIATADIAADDDGAAKAAVLIDAMRTMIVSGASISADYHVAARRPMPPDGFPVVGRIDALPGLYVAVMHSGITLAPAIGRMVAQEVLTGTRDSLLLPYGPGRLLQRRVTSPVALYQAS